jgi:Bacteriophage tail sheath protein
MAGSTRYPGVYVEETPGGAHAIEGVATSIALFAGWTPRGPGDRARRVDSFADFEREFGGLDARSLLGYAVQQFFANGGRVAWIMRIAGTKGRALGPTDAGFHRALLRRFGPGSATDRIDLYTLVCIPGLTDAATLAALQAECRRRRAFLIVDADPEATVERMASEGTAGLTGPDGSYSALYFPWVRAADPLQSGAMRAFPPCGFIAGLMARTDVNRGVWKAPAGPEATLTGATGLAVGLSDPEQGRLNPRAINGLRMLPGIGTVVWSARTLHGQDDRASEWKYIPVRRLALYIEESLYRGTRWATFEPNGEPLWERIRLDVGAFMHALFRQGALQGRTDREAYFVQCDPATTTRDDIDQGFVNFVVGFAPLKPAEFVILRIRQAAGRPGDSS